MYTEIRVVLLRASSALLRFSWQEALSAYFFQSNDSGKSRHDRNAHRPNGEHDQHIRPATAHAKDTVTKPHLEGSEKTILRTSRKEAKRGDALRHTSGLQGRELIQTCCDQNSTRNNESDHVEIAEVHCNCDGPVDCRIRSHP